MNALLKYGADTTHPSVLKALGRLKRRENPAEEIESIIQKVEECSERGEESVESVLKRIHTSRKERRQCKPGKDLLNGGFDMIYEAYF